MAADCFAKKLAPLKVKRCRLNRSNIQGKMMEAIIVLSMAVLFRMIVGTEFFMLRCRRNVKQSIKGLPILKK